MPSTIRLSAESPSRANRETNEAASPRGVPKKAGAAIASLLPTAGLEKPRVSDKNSSAPESLASIRSVHTAFPFRFSRRSHGAVHRSGGAVSREGTRQSAGSALGRATQDLV